MGAANMPSSRLKGITGAVLPSGFTSCSAVHRVDLPALYGEYWWFCSAPRFTRTAYVAAWLHGCTPCGHGLNLKLKPCRTS